MNNSLVNGKLYKIRNKNRDETIMYSLSYDFLCLIPNDSIIILIQQDFKLYAEYKKHKIIYNNLIGYVHDDFNQLEKMK